MKETLKWFAPLLIALTLFGSVFLFVEHTRQAGYDEGLIAGKAEGAATYQKLKDEIDEERLALAREALAKAQADAQSLLEQIKRGDDLASQLTTTKQELRRNTDKLNGEIERVTTLYRRALDAPPEPLPVAVFTTGFVRVWNESLNPLAMHGSQPTSGATTFAGNTGAADDLDSGITPAVLLSNQVRNSEKHASCRAQLTSLIEYYTHGRI
ncbi:DNA-packaging protein [Pseudomonas gregormendelii]|uniref:DNA-packaging protein n=1 Tax=Pseudomonas gregormendelii TaxID=1628277 RepID=A0ABS3AQB8_9PSED|nr:DNA-packaging protein [Pseudomonas gregormendelii]MBN3968530.1 DNA-packaging protein [Pseudomonas gregormendelii]